ncbi:MAG: T9SS type A sorting domain-containing protein [Pedobacter sp.]|nr:MAG: T9SS type A sorting domain-containing protein [Pedobacter sp.]
MPRNLKGIPLEWDPTRIALWTPPSLCKSLLGIHCETEKMYINLSDGVNRDETAIVFKEGFDANFDEIDAPYLSGSTVILSSFSADGKANAINYMPALNTISQVKLNVNAAASGALTLNFSNIATFAGFKVTLQDTYLNTLTDVKANPVYGFSIDRTIASSFGANRFVLLFEGTLPLQINLAAFTAAQQNTGVLLNWATATEQSSTRIEIERSANNTTFTKIGEKAGAGTTTAATVYSFTDTAPLNGLNYYRLKQVYADGTFSYSEIKSVTYTKPGYTPPKITFKLYPNPADHIIHIDVTGIRSKLIIYDLFGRIVKTNSYEIGEQVKMDITALRTGVYFAELKDLSTNRPTDIIIFFKK